MASAKRGTIKIGLIQAKAGPDIASNLEKARSFISRAAKKGAKIICLQELFAIPYIAQKEDRGFFRLAEGIPGKNSHFLAQAAKESKVALVGGSFFENDNGKYYNTSLIFDENGRLRAKYRKIHIPNDPNYYEQFYFSSGNLGYVQAELHGIKIAPLICYDQWFPEAARINALKGAQIIFYPTAIGWTREMKKNEPFSAQRWENAMCGHASMNGVYVAAANRVGKEGNIGFWGGSFVADPFGNVVARANSTKEEVLVAEIDLSKVSSSQEGWGFLRNRKPKSYGDLSEI
ncbi:acyltransferase [Candidatus Woesearchaeota archaeon]|nr:acyltransferase [Candidatus Woesearchaeota archaeon]